MDDEPIFYDNQNGLYFFFDEGRFTLEEDQLCYSGRNFIEDETYKVPFSDITSIHIVNHDHLDGLLGTCRVRLRNGRKIVLRSFRYSFPRVTAMQTEQFAQFVSEICRRVDLHNPKTRFFVGNSLEYYMCWLGLSTPFIVLAILAVLMGPNDSELLWQAALALVTPFLGALILFRRSIRRGKRRAFDPKEPPTELQNLLQPSQHRAAAAGIVAVALAHVFSATR
jgi:Na+-transporting methylmalonyl-CoA/oxaloacetate decarboxylase gamma subunit